MQSVLPCFHDPGFRNDLQNTMVLVDSDIKQGVHDVGWAGLLSAGMPGTFGSDGKLRVESTGFGSAKLSSLPLVRSRRGLAFLRVFYSKITRVFC